MWCAIISIVLIMSGGFLGVAQAWNPAAVRILEDKNGGFIAAPFHPLCYAIREQVRLEVSDRMFSEAQPSETVALFLRERAFADPGGDSIEGRVQWAPSSRASLVVILPGIFQGADHALPRDLANRLHEMGMHVITFSSPFSEAYLEKIPFAAVGSFEAEAQIYLQALENLHERFASRIDEVHVLGLSYGAFIASVMAATDSRGSITGNITLLSPVFRMATTQRLIDEMLDAGMSAPYTNPCSWAAAQQTLPDIIRFTRSLLQQYMEHRNQEWWNERFSSDAQVRFTGALSLTKNEQKEWETGLRFQNVLRRYTSENLHYYQEGKDLLSYWLSQARDRGFTRFRWLSAKDDFLNDATELEGEQVLPAWLRTPEFGFFLEEGSHLSYINWTLRDGYWFSDFLSAAYLEPSQKL